MTEEYLLSRYMSAAEILPRYLKEKLYRINKEDMLEAEEIRLRSVSGMTLLSAGKEKPVSSEPIKPSELADIVCAAANSSLHTAAASISEGFITSGGGHRVGVCGTAAVRDGKICGINNYSSLAIRISKEIKTAAQGLEDILFANGKPCSALIISPPGGGKTTLLRDLIRRMSNLGVRVALADERGEIAAVKNGVPQLDVGKTTDVMDMTPRAEAVMFLVRAMNPELIAMDEISSERELGAVRAVFGCGTAILATAHGFCADELKGSGRYRELLREGIFEYIIDISGAGAGRRARAVHRSETI